MEGNNRALPVSLPLYRRCLLSCPEYTLCTIETHALLMIIGIRYVTAQPQKQPRTIFSSLFSSSYDEMSVYIWEQSSTWEEHISGLYFRCCPGYDVTFIMMSWIIQIGLFSCLSLRRIIHARVPRDRLPSFLCLNLRLPMPDNTPAMIINHSYFYSTKIQIQIISDFSFPLLYILLCVCVCVPSGYCTPEMYTMKCFCSLSSSSLPFPAQQLWCTQCLSQQLEPILCQKRGFPLLFFPLIDCHMWLWIC